MKQLRLFFWSIFVVSSVFTLSAMEDEQPSRRALFSAKYFNVDLMDRGQVGDFYRKIISMFDNFYDSAVDTALVKNIDTRISELQRIIRLAPLIGEASEHDLNLDTFKATFEGLLDRASDSLIELHEEKRQAQADLETRSASIRSYWNQVHGLRDRFDTIKNEEYSLPVEQNIVLLQAIVNEARLISERSQQELHEVGFAHELAPLIHRVEKMIQRLRVVEQTPQRSRCAKRSLGDEFANQKRSKTY